MGKQRSRSLIRKAEALFARFPAIFSNDFEKNKRALDSLKDDKGEKIFKSKLQRDIIAGVICKLATGKEL